MRKSKLKLALNGLWLHLTREKYAQIFQTNLTSGTGGSGPVLSRYHALQSPCAAWRGRRSNTSRLAAAWRGSGNDTCECFIEPSFNACVIVMLLQDRRTPLLIFWVGQVLRSATFVFELAVRFRYLTMCSSLLGRHGSAQSLLRTRFTAHKWHQTFR